MAIEERQRTEYKAYCDKCSALLGTGASKEEARNVALEEGGKWWRKWTGIQYVYVLTCEECSKDGLWEDAGFTPVR